MSENALRISRARHLLMRRLEQLELTLPPKPISVAKRLLRAVWATYDDEISSLDRTHWIDIHDRYRSTKSLWLMLRGLAILTLSLIALRLATDPAHVWKGFSRVAESVSAPTIMRQTDAVLTSPRPLPHSGAINAFDVGE